MLARRARLDQSFVLNPGQLRELITWQRRKDPATVNSWGEDKADPPESDWEDVQEMRAEIRTGSGRELYAAQQVWAEAKYQITHYFFEGLSAGMQIAWKVNATEVRYLDVLNVGDPVGSKRYIIAIARDFNG